MHTYSSSYPEPEGEQSGLPAESLRIGAIGEGVKQKCQKEPGKGTRCQERPLVPHSAPGASS